MSKVQKGGFASRGCGCRSESVDDRVKSIHWCAEHAPTEEQVSIFRPLPETEVPEPGENWWQDDRLPPHLNECLKRLGWLYVNAMDAKVPHFSAAQVARKRIIGLYTSRPPALQGEVVATVDVLRLELANGYGYNHLQFIGCEGPISEGTYGLTLIRAEDDTDGD